MHDFRDDDDRAYERHVAEVLGGIVDPVYPWQDSFWNFCPFTEKMAATADELPFA
jgi:hypothetical protein